jgi:hypothetical protein
MMSGKFLASQTNQFLIIFQRKRLVAEQAGDDNAAGRPGIERMLCDQIRAVGDDLVGILHQLELLVAVLPVQPHALADDFKDVDDAKRPVALVRAQFAMVGMIDGDQRIDAGIRRGLKLAPLQLALEGGKHA